MANDRPEKDSTSSIVMKAIDATTFNELQAFVKDLEARPTERLLQDVGELVKPSASKAHLVGFVIATKFRHASPDERQKIFDSLAQTMNALPAGEQHDRVNGIIERLRAQE